MMKVLKIQFKNGLKKLLKLGRPTTENINTFEPYYRYCNKRCNLVGLLKCFEQL